jgi:hypothetical protein
MKTMGKEENISSYPGTLSIKNMDFSYSRIRSAKLGRRRYQRRSNGDSHTSISLVGKQNTGTEPPTSFPWTRQWIANLTPI